MIGSLGANEEKAFKTLLELDTRRGPHSTGVFVAPRHINNFTQYKLVKSLGTPWDLYDTQAWKSALNGINKCIIGHNRWATRGAVTVGNAHPFEFNHIVGAHNGSIYNHTKFDPKNELAVDSQAIFNYLSQHGARETLENIHGPFALTWFDKNEQTMNIVRNKDRPLCFVYTEDRQTMFWASEAWMLSIALQLANIKFGEVMQFAELVHYSFDLTNPKVEELNKPRAYKIKEFVPPPVVHVPRSYGSWGGGTGYGRESSWDEDGYYNPPQGRAANRRFQDVYGPKNRQSATPLPLPSLPPPANKDVGKYTPGEFVAFTVTKVMVRSKDVPSAYIQAFVTDNPSQAVRLYPVEGGFDWKLMAHVGFKFKGKIKPTSNPHYLLIDLRSVVLDKDLPNGGQILSLEDFDDDDDDDNEDGQLYPIGSGGVKGNAEAFQEATKKGCAICTSPVSKEDAEKLVWILDDSDFVCHGCQSTDIGREYCSLDLGVC